MYEALENNFLKVETWTSRHWSDDERFYRDLNMIVRQPGFSEIELGKYIMKKHAEQFGSAKPAIEEAKILAENFASRAAVVLRFLEAIGEVKT